MGGGGGGGYRGEAQGELRASSGRARGNGTRPNPSGRAHTATDTATDAAPPIPNVTHEARVDYTCLRVYVSTRHAASESTDLLSCGVFFFAQDLVFLSLMPRPLHRPGPHTRSHPVLLSLYFREFSYILWKEMLRSRLTAHERGTRPDTVPIRTQSHVR